MGSCSFTGIAISHPDDKARLTPPRTLTTPAANTTGDWLAPSGCIGAACVMYCRNTSSQLIETTTADTACIGATVIANNVSALLATLPANMGAIDRSAAVVALTLADATGNTVSLSSTVRLGGGTQ